MSRSIRGTHVRVYQSNGGMTVFAATAYEAITHALLTGAAFYEGEALYGSTVCIRISDVTDVHFVTEASMAAATADEQAANTEPWNRSE